MAALPYMQLYPADYLADTMHLTATEHGAYLLLLMNYWQTGKPIPKTRLAAITRTGIEWPDIEPVLSEFFEDDGHSWIHLRVEQDLHAIHTKPRGKNLPEGESLKGYKGYVYFVTEPGIDTVKIGYSKNPWARIKELRRTEDNYDLSVVATIKTVAKSETTVHELFSSEHSHGEWYKKTSRILSVIEKINNKDISDTYELSDVFRSDFVATTVVTTGNYDKTTTATTNTDPDPDPDKEKKKTNKKSSPSADALGNTEPAGEESTDNAIAREVIAYFNEVTGKNFKPVATHFTLIRARLNEKHSLDEIKAVIRMKHAEWSNDKQMAKFVNPGTIFKASNFNKYIGHVPQFLASEKGHAVVDYRAGIEGFEE